MRLRMHTWDTQVTLLYCEMLEMEKERLARRKSMSGVESDEDPLSFVR